MEYSTIADLIFDENQPVGKSTNYILTLQVDESTNVWSFNILDSNKTRVFFKHYEAKFDNSSKIGRYISPSPPNWNPYDNRDIKLKLNTPIVLYSEAIIDENGYPAYVNNESDIKAKLKDKSVGLQNIAFLRLVVE